MTAPIEFDRIRDAIAGVRTIAVLGAHVDAYRPAFYVPDYMYRHGYRILPVNPQLAGQTVFGQTIRKSLAEIDEAVDLVDVFRRSEVVPTHVPDILAMRHRPRVVWLQSGIWNDEAARQLEAAGIHVVQDRCLMVEHRRTGLQP